ncbi:MAG TPA: murein transglycosylase A [Rhizomicrobium sp.]|jgi:membrane-bound lytic murein transglycosylase A|nr:murein transglycosylase A [Rhizomicrobium sp.]
MAKKTSRAGVFWLLAILLLAAAATFWWWKTQVPSAGAAVSLRRADYTDLPGWNTSDPRAALAAFRRTCTALAKLPAERAMGSYAGTVGDWQGACSAVPDSASSAASARSFFETWFAPVAVGGEGLFTGYYEPELRASRTRHGPYQTPIYGLPNDLVSVDLGQFKPELAGEHIEGQLIGHTLEPYPARADIDAHGVAAQTLFYAEDPIAVFFLHVQGSGRVRLEDGQSFRVAYAGQNGRPYTPVGRTLIEQGALTRGEVSLQAIRGWLKTHTEKLREVLETDQSFVFFQEKPVGDATLGSEGSEGVALTPGASLAVDAHLHPLGAPFYVATTTAETDAGKSVPLLQRLFVAQDTGGAIRGAVRGDVFWGFGPAAEDMAGRMTSRGRFFVLLPKPVAARLDVGA